MLREIIDVDEVREEIQDELRKWFECVDFEFVIEKLIDRGLINSERMYNGKDYKFYDSVYELIEEEMSKFFKDGS